MQRPLLTKKYSKLNKPHQKRSWLTYVYIVCTLLIIVLFIVARSSKSPIIAQETSKSTSQSTSVLLVPYIGQLNPNISDHFFKSVKYQPFDVLFVSMDGKDILENHNTTQIRHLDLNTDFYGFASDKLCLAYNCTLNEKGRLRHAMQKTITKYGFFLCLLRPAFLYIFKEFLNSYSYVGWGDIDMVFSDIDLLTPYLNDHDIVTVGGSDLNRLYLRGQLTFFKNTESLSKAFIDPMPLSLMLKYFETPAFMAEEALYSQYMFSSTYSILIVPFQKSSWDCKKHFKLENTTVVCDLFTSDTKPTYIPLHDRPFELVNAPQIINEPCDTFWINIQYRGCLNQNTPAFISYSNGTAKVYKLSDKEHYMFSKYPLFYHFQLEKHNQQELEDLFTSEQ